MISHRIDGRLYVTYADGGIDEFLDILNADIRKGSSAGRRAARALTRLHESFRCPLSNKYVNGDEAMRLARKGWHAGADAIQQLLTATLPTTAMAPAGKRWHMDMAGSLPDVGRYCTGSPDHMLNRRRSDGKQRIVHLIMNTALVDGATAQQQWNIFAAYCGLIDYMEARGIRVEIDRLGIVSQGSVVSFQGWKVKRANEPLDLASVAFSLAHISAHRHLVWAARELFPTHTWNPVQIRSVRRTVDKVLGYDNAIGLDGLANMSSKNATMTNDPAGAMLLVARRLNDAVPGLLDMDELAARLGTREEERA